MGARSPGAGFSLTINYGVGVSHRRMARAGWALFRLAGAASLSTFLVVLALLATFPALGITALRGTPGYVVLVVATLLSVILGFAVTLLTLEDSAGDEARKHPEPVGLFLDVDEVLTKGLVQHHYARSLGCEAEYQQIEDRFQRGTIGSAEFGEAIVRLFASKSLSPQRARDIASKMELQPRAAELLRHPVRKYLVSMGPSYFVQWLASHTEFNIRPTDVICSTYVFDEMGVLSRCDAVDPAEKARWTKERIGRHRFTIGIGDNVERDGAFLSACTLGIMTRLHEPPSYLVSPGLPAVTNLVDQLGQIYGAKWPREGAADRSPPAP